MTRDVILYVGMKGKRADMDPFLSLGILAVVRLTHGQQGKMTFRCDLHPNLEGELYLLDVPVG